MVSTTFSVDMSNYQEKFENVCLNGTFNNWCGSCNTMSDDDNDGVYEITVEVPSGEIEYKFTIDGWNLEETFEKGMPCSKTTGEFTNRVASVYGDTSLSKVCFNACSTCE
jgi:1,4-alpha-glucan branching enzyme